MDLTEAEEIKKRWQEYTEELYKKAPNGPDNHDGVVTHLEPDILEYEVEGALGIFTKTNLNITKFTVHILLKPGLENFEHFLLAFEMSAIVW